MGIGTRAPLAFRPSYLSGLFRRKTASREFRQLGGRAARGGRAGCAGCGGTWPVRNSVPRFVPEEEDYAGGFGFQWQRWRLTQIDRLNGTTLTTDRLLTDTGWDRDWIAGRLIFDGGAGAGRFSDALAAMGARVVSLDMSIAIDACCETTRVHGDAVQCIQASLMPYRCGRPPLTPSIAPG